jgi:hypothetical protein
MKATDFKVGDRVEVIANFDENTAGVGVFEDDVRLPAGLQGTVVLERPRKVLIQFDPPWNDGHNGNSVNFFSEKSDCWWFGEFGSPYTFLKIIPKPYNPILEEI